LVTRNNVIYGSPYLEVICIKIGSSVVSGETDKEYTVDPCFERERQKLDLEVQADFLDV
jgi:hypothetical protein